MTDATEFRVGQVWERLSRDGIKYRYKIRRIDVRGFEIDVYRDVRYFGISHVGRRWLDGATLVTQEAE